MMDDDKVDLDLIAALIRHIVLEEEVRFCLLSSHSNDVAVGNVRADSLASHADKKNNFLFCSSEK